MDVKVEAVKDVQTLIDRYGLAVVDHCVNFLAKFPSTPKTYTARNREHTAEITLSEAQYNTLRAVWGDGYNKINTIKMLRDMFTLALRDAKEMTEYLFQSMYHF